MTDTHKTQIIKRIHKRNTALERSVRKSMEGLNMFDGTNFTLISDVDQDKQIKIMWLFFVTQYNSSQPFQNPKSSSC